MVAASRELGNSLRALIALSILIAVLYPIIGWLRPGFEVILTYGVILAIAALGFNLLFGYTGLLSFGHAAFFGVGAYTIGLTLKYLNLRALEAQIFIAVVAALLFSALTGFIVVRYRGIFFAILILVIAQTLWGFYVKFYHITGGTDGIRILRPVILGFYDTRGLGYDDFNMIYHYYALAWFILMAYLMWRIINSPFGYTLKMIRDAEDRAQTLGIDTFKFKLAAFIISALYVAVSGALYAPLNRIVTPDLAYWTVSGKMVFMSILGGFTYYMGPIVGALIYVYFETVAQAITVHWFLIMGVLIIATMVLTPTGLMGLVDRPSFKKTLSLLKLPI
ncbi:MAG: branched-chain amino acid ABC transporter permease [Thermoprotei archaeon]|nr:branched-chain amino acid ABC transporter permease [Thermoprotei archaeon]